jgi:hypothetical protein
LRKGQRSTSREVFVEKNKSRIRNRTHTQPRFRTLNHVFSVTKPYPCLGHKMDNKTLYFRKLSYHGAKLSILGFRVRKRGCLHVLPWGGRGGMFSGNRKSPKRGLETATAPTRLHWVGIETTEARC